MTDQIERLQDPETIRLHMGELTASEMRVAQAAIRYALAGVEGERGWLPIESAPREKGMLLILHCPNNWNEPDVGWWREVTKGEGHYVNHWSELQPTHWMPLPQPPKENGG